MEQLGVALHEELERFGPMAAIGALARAWPAAVGDQIARNAWPARVNRDGTLIVYTRDSIWAYELGQREAEIRERLGDLVPGTLRFVPGPIPELAPEPEARTGRPTPEPSPEALVEAASLTAAIADDELRKIVLRAVAVSLEAARSGRGF
jgi:Dna[CI] antecedent, DciA